MANIALLVLCSAIVTHHLISAYSPLRLGVDPSFLQVKEDWKVGTPLDVAVCGPEGFNQSSLTISNGDPVGHFKLQPFNESCWSLVLKRELDADCIGWSEPSRGSTTPILIHVYRVAKYIPTNACVQQQNAQGTRGQTFSLTFQLNAGRQQSKGNLVIQVIDINDNAPRFIDTPSDVSISEIAASGTLVATLTTFDPDIGIGGINTFRLKDNPERKFRLGDGDGACSNSKCKAQLFLDGSLDYATRSTYKLIIVAVDGAGRTLRVNPTEFTLVVNVIDVQNSPPRFVTDGRPQKVPENVALGTQIFQVVAEDGDTGADHHHAIRYRVAGEKRFFDINPDSGWVFVVKPLDRESAFVNDANGAVNLTIEAEEVPESADEKPLTSRLDIIVLVTDVDDESPRCNRSSYTVQVAENSALHQPAATVDGTDILAFDLDQEPNAAFDVSLSGPGAPWFDVYPKSVNKQSTLQLRVRDATGLDYEESPSLSFDIVLTPTTGSTKIKPSRCAINVNILDVNDNAPQFNQSELVGRVLESEPKGTIVMTVTTTDIDSDRFGPILYTITGNGAENFKIGSDGSIATTVSLDREKRAQYQLTLTAIDGAGKGNRQTIPLIVAVQDINDNPPVFEQPTYIAYLLEGATTFTQFPNGFPVKATDLDEPGTNNSRVSYYFLNDNKLATQNFSIDSTSGIIQPIGSIDLESMVGNVVNLTIRAEDQGEPRQSSTAILIVYVNDTNDNSPVFDQLEYNVTIDEIVKPLTPILNVTATDADRSDRNRQITYRIDDVQDRFIIDSKSGLLSVGKRTSLDLPANPVQYALTIVAVDSGSPPRSTTATVIISVNDINDKPPYFAQSVYNARVSEKAPAFTSLLKLTAGDPDETAIMHYNISGFSEAKTVDGRKVDDLPGAYDYARRFGIRPHNGELFLRETVDRERLESVVIHITAMDINGEVNTPQTGETTVKVEVLDENDNAPVFEKSVYLATVQENAPRNSVVLSVVARDTDATDKTIRYSIIDFTNAELSGSIVIDDAGIVRVVGLIDFEKTQWINATIVAEDSDKNVGTATLHLQVIDQNDNSPVFHPGPSYTASIAETAPPGSVVKLRGPNANVTATDRDSGSFGQVSYFLLNDADDSAAAFTINRRTGAIITTKPLDRENKASYSLTVRAVDDFNSSDIHPDSHEATAVVEITIDDVNDNAPTFVPGTATKLTLSENDVAGTQVAVFSATDRDAGDNDNGKVRYFIVNGNSTIAGTPMFALDPQSGILSLVDDLRGKYGYYYLAIEARDLGTPESLSNNLSVSIAVRDFNDHRPVIYNPAHQSVHLVRENTDEDNSSIVQVKAMDQDEGDNAKLRYFFKNTAANEDWHYFLINERTGEVWANVTFDYEIKNRYVLIVAACDRGNPPQCSEVEFTVAVQDINDECPYFDLKPEYIHRLTIPENQAVTAENGVPVGQIPAALDDDGMEENRQTCYRIEQTNGGRTAPFFLKSADSRVLMTNESLDREAQAVYKLRIRTYDCAQQCQTVSDAPIITADRTLLEVMIEVRDVNDNFPQFIQQSFRGGGVHGKTKLGDRVARVFATDADDSDVGQLRYEIKGRVRSEFENGYLDTDRQSLFILDNITGDIFSNLHFQDDWNGNFLLTVAVVDSAGHEDTATVTINLLGYDQQIELLFEIPANRVWDNAATITRLLSEATTWSSAIDDVRMPPTGTVDINQSKVLVHFLDPNNSVVPIDIALHTLDKPQSEAQKTAKRQLIEVHKLKYAGHTPFTPTIGLSKANMAIYFGVAGVVGGLTLVMAVLVVVWSCQNRSYKRKLKAATTLAFGTADPTISPYDVPGTNLHATSNPVWLGAYETYGVGRDNYALDYDDRRSQNSLDRNALTKSATPRSSNLVYGGGKNQFGAFRINGEVNRAPSSTPREPEADYPRELLANLESTEL